MIESTLAQAGIYKITNVLTGKFYIGRTHNFKIRARSHINALKRGDHSNSHMQRIYNKRGDVFVFEPLLICAKKDTRFFEQRALDILCPVERGYNLSRSCEAYERDSNTKAHNAKISAAHKGKKYSQERKDQTRKTLLSKDAGAKYTAFGKTQTLRTWANEYGLTYNVLQHRVRLRGSVETALSCPTLSKAEVFEAGRQVYISKVSRLKFDGREYTVCGFSRLLGINRKTFYYWENKLGSQEKAVGYLAGKYYNGY